MAHCTHLDSLVAREPKTLGCEECLKSGGEWLHLRLCLECGHVGCCDSSPSKHATAHFHATKHPVIKSFEPEEDWGFCYVDNVMLQGGRFEAITSSIKQPSYEG